MSHTHINLEDLPDVAQAIRDKREKESQTYPVRSTYASKIGHPCQRMLVYHRTFWDLLKKPDAGLMGIFRRGRNIGEDIVVEAKEALKGSGVNILEQEVQIPPNEFDIGGRIDFVLEFQVPELGVRPIRVPVEAKSMHDGYFGQLPDDDEEAVAWMLNHPSAYMRCYPTQILTYMHFRKIDAGIIFVRSAQSFEDRQIRIRMNPEIVDRVLERAIDIKERTAKILEARGAWDSGEPVSSILERVDDLLPDRIDFDPGVCGKCDFQPWCIPDITKAQGILAHMDDEELEADCRIWNDMKDPRDAYEAANKRITGHCKSVMADEKPGTTKVALTKSFGVTMKKTAKSVTKKILPLDDILGGEEDD
jgi:hypothetical protein